MDIDPMESAAPADEQDGRNGPPQHLGTWIALTVALLATFLAICKVKDDNIVQAMQQIQADRIDQWAFYQARNLREEVANATRVQLELAEAGVPVAERPRYEEAIRNYKQLADEQAQKKEEVRQQAEQAEARYDALNYRDDQFDLSDAAIAVAISLLAISALTRKKWLYFVALVPAMIGIAMGTAGLAGLPLHPASIVKLLT